MSDTSEWPLVRFGDVVKLNKERVVDPEAEGIERFVGIEHIEPEDLRIRSWGLVAEGTTFTTYFQPGQVLFVKRRAYQRKVALANFEGVCSGDIYVLESKDPNRLLPELLPFICQTESFFEHAVGTSAGSLSPRTNWTQLAKYEFALPPLEEQRRLKVLLQASLSMTEAHERVVNATRACVNAAREYFFANQRANSISLGEALKTVEAGKSLVGTNRPPLSGEHAVIKVSAIGANGFIPTESKTLVEQGAFLPEFSIKSGDLIVTRANTSELVGMACFVEQDFPNLMLCDKTLRLIPKDEISPKLLWEALWTRAVRQQIKAVATGTGAAMKNVSQAKLRKLRIQLPANTDYSSNVLAQMSALRGATLRAQERSRKAMSLHIFVNNALLSGSNS